jgi:hypothetical protein
VAAGDGIDGIEGRLVAAARARREHEIVERHRLDVDRRLTGSRAQRERWAAALTAEQRDVERLTDLTLTRVLARLRGRLSPLTRRAVDGVNAAATGLGTDEFPASFLAAWDGAAAVPYGAHRTGIDRPLDLADASP